MDTAPHIRRGSALRRTLVSLVLIVMSIAVCIVTTIAAVDVICHGNINEWQPLYPDAEQIGVEHTNLRPRAMGRSVVVLQTEDDPLTVRNWYTAHERQTFQSGATRGLASTNTDVQRDDDDTVTVVYLFSECAYN